MTYDHDLDMFNENDELEQDLNLTWYDYNLFSNPGALNELVAAVVKAVDARIVSDGVPKRKQKPTVRLSYEKCIDSIISNMSYVFLRWRCNVPIAVSRRTSISPEHTNIYLPSKTFIRCLDLLEVCGFLSQSIGRRHGDRTTIKATAIFQSVLDASSLSFSCFRECDSRPLVVLRRSKQGKPGKKRRREPVSIKSRPEVPLMSSQVDRLNVFLRASDIRFDNDCVLPLVDDSRRTLVRYFTIREKQECRFDQGGRLFGSAFWLALKSDRRGSIRINGEPVADLDFSNLGPRIAYHLAGYEAPEGDLYDLSGLLPGYDHSDKAQRKAIKRAFASCLNGGRGGKRGIKPKAGKPGTTGILDPLPRGINAAKIRKALIAKHPVLEPFFEPREVPVGFTIMFLESQILLCALEKLMALGVVALPQHDGLMVARSNAKIAKEELEAASRDVLGVTIPAVVKDVCGPPIEFEEALAA